MDQSKQMEYELLQLIAKERYQDAVDLASQFVREDENNHLLYYLKGYAHIFMQKYSDALIDLGEASYLNPMYLPTMHAFAYIFLRQEDFDSAIKKWMSILKIDPKDKVALRSIKKFKKKIPSGIDLGLNPKNYLELPKVKKSDLKVKKVASGEKSSKGFLKGFLYFLLICIILGGGYIGYIYYLKGKRFNFSSGSKKEIPFSKKVFYSFTPKEIEFYKKQAFELVNKEKYNQAKLLMNKFYYSNASLEDKKLLRTWDARLSFPEKDELDVNFTVKEVFEKPYLYKDCFVNWKGEVLSFSQKEKYIFFTVSLKDSKKVSALYLSNLFLKKGDKISFYGKIRLKNKDEVELEIYQLEKK